MRKEPFNIPNITDSLKSDYQLGLITLQEAAEELYYANLTPYVSIELTKEQLGLKK